MKYSISETNGKKTYIVNDVTYERLEDVPPQFQHLFEDKNNDGRPDGFEFPIDTSNPFTIFKGLISLGTKGMTGSSKSKPKPVKPEQRKGSYNQGREETSIRPTIIKIVVVSMFVFVVYWVYQVYQAPLPVATGSDELVVEPEIADEADGASGNNESTDGTGIEKTNPDGDIKITLEDPNVAPYHVFISVYINNNVFFTLDPPEGMTLNDASSNATLEFYSDGISGTTLEEKRYTYNVSYSPCEMDTDSFEWSKINLGGKEFSKSVSDEGAAGHNYQSYTYAMQHQHYCVLFTYVFKTVNPALVETPLTGFDAAAEIEKLEAQLAKNSVALKKYFFFLMLSNLFTIVQNEIIMKTSATKIQLAAFFLLCLTLSKEITAQPKDAFTVQVKIENGIIEGLYDVHTGLQFFLGVPFAKPPVGDLRWKEPQPLDNWNSVKQTKSFGPRAIQAPVFGDMNFRSDGMSEDCLYLNVWTPAKRNTTSLPVLVYFYGGGFVAGDGSEPRYDGANMAKKGIVVVTVNYRLGLFGFFAHPELSKETSYKGSGNYGLLDQAMALKWVQKNIVAFGGDPKKVTIAGESAGSISVSAQMVSPLSKGLIAGAIGESGSGISALAAVPLTEAEKIGSEFATKAGYNSLAQLRAASTQELYEVYTESRRFGFPSVIDGYFYTKPMMETFNAKEQAQVPLLLGWNSAEIPGAAFMQGKPLTKENFIAKVKEVYPKNYEEALKAYPYESDLELQWAATNLASDRFISYSTWKWFDAHRNNSKQPVFRYLYSKLRPPMVDQSLSPGLAGGTVRNQGNQNQPKPIGAPHACEIEYCMGNLALVKEYQWTEDDYKVSETMMNYFANFIKTGNPNGENLPEWPPAKASDKNPPVMVLDVESKPVNMDDSRYWFLDKMNK